MKDFQEFKKSIDQQTLDKWSEEVYNDLAPKLDALLKDEPEKWNSAYQQSYALKMSMRLLETYHKWLNDEDGFAS